MCRWSRQIGPQREKARPGNRGWAVVNSANPPQIRVAGEIAITRKDRGAIVILREDNDIRLLIPRTGEEISFTFSRIIGRAEISVPETPFDFESAKLMFENDVEDAGYRIRAVDGGRSVFKNVNM